LRFGFLGLVVCLGFEVWDWDLRWGIRIKSKSKTPAARGESRDYDHEYE
jgi:hypothetical protein